MFIDMFKNCTIKYNLYYGENVSIQVAYPNGKILSVPLDETNTDYQMIQEWVAEGNVIEEQK
jgi:hypothetical protein